MNGDPGVARPGGTGRRVTRNSMLCCALFLLRFGLARCAVIEKHALAVRLSGTLTDDYSPLSQVSA